MSFIPIMLVCPWDARENPWDARENPWDARENPWDARENPWDARKNPWDARERTLFVSFYCAGHNHGSKTGRNLQRLDVVWQMESHLTARFSKKIYTEVAYLSVLLVSLIWYNFSSLQVRSFW